MNQNYATETAITLRRLMVNDCTLDELRVLPSDGDDRRNDAVADVFPRGAVGWKVAGEVVGNSSGLAALAIYGGDEEDGVDKMAAFFDGLKRNSSMERLSFFGWDAFRGRAFPLMAPLLENQCITLLNIDGCAMGADGLRLLASALSGEKTHRLEYIAICNCSIEYDDTMFEEFVAALNLDHVARPCQDHTLDTLDLERNHIGRRGCSALEKILSNPLSKLRKLSLKQNRIDDQGVASLANGLGENENLAFLDIVDGNPITNRGWASLSKTICNTESINDTFLSNHKVNNLGQGMQHVRGTIELPNDLISYLNLNSKSALHPWEDETTFIPIQKILDNHRDWNMSPCIHEDLGLLPHIVRWFERAFVKNKNFNGSTANSKRWNERTLQRRLLFTIYQFIGSMPQIAAEKVDILNK